jgi:hypothetical protein
MKITASDIDDLALGAVFLATGVAVTRICRP